MLEFSDVSILHNKTTLLYVVKIPNLEETECQNYLIKPIIKKNQKKPGGCVPYQLLERININWQQNIQQHRKYNYKNITPEESKRLKIVSLQTLQVLHIDNTEKTDKLRITAHGVDAVTIICIGLLIICVLYLYKKKQQKKFLQMAPPTPINNLQNQERNPHSILTTYHSSKKRSRTIAN